MSFKADLGLWKSFLDDFDGRSFFRSDDWLPSNLLNLYTDAAGFGAIFVNFWFYGPWPEEWKKLNIVVLEFFPIRSSVSTYGVISCETNAYYFTRTTQHWSRS